MQFRDSDDTEVSQCFTLYRVRTAHGLPRRSKIGVLTEATSLSRTAFEQIAAQIIVGTFLIPPFYFCRTFDSSAFLVVLVFICSAANTWAPAAILRQSPTSVASIVAKMDVSAMELMRRQNIVQSSSNDWVFPPPSGANGVNNSVFTIGSTLNVSWVSTFTSSNLELHQSGSSDVFTIASNLVNKWYVWNVTNATFSLSDSTVFFMWQRSGNDVFGSSFLNFTTKGNIVTAGFASTTSSSSFTSSTSLPTTTGSSTSATTASTSTSTQANSTASSSSSSSIGSGAIAGIVIGVVALLALAGFLGWWFGYRRRRNGKYTATDLSSPVGTAKGAIPMAKDVKYDYAPAVPVKHEVHEVNGAPDATRYELDGGQMRQEL